MLAGHSGLICSIIFHICTNHCLGIYVDLISSIFLILLNTFTQFPFVKLQSSLTVQSKSVGLGVDFIFSPSQVSK